jgi:hypothetical protein
MESQTILFYVDNDTEDLEFFKEISESIDVPIVLFDRGDDLIERIKTRCQPQRLFFLT